MATAVATAMATAAAATASTATARAAHGGHYQNYSFDQLWEFIQTNPNNGICLDKPGRIPTDYTQPPSSQSLGLDGFQFQFLKPSGLLSVFTYIATPLFRDAAPHLAKALRLEFGTEFLSSLESKIAGTRFLRKRKNIQESMNSLINIPGILTKDVEQTVGLLCDVQNIQAILVSNFSTEHGQEQTTSPRILFSSDPGDWNSEKQTWIFDINGAWIMDQVSDAPHISLSSWVEDKEKEGWIVEWPVANADVKKTDMVECLRESIFWTTADEKQKKDVLAPRYSRHRALVGLRTISYGGTGTGTDTGTGADEITGV